MLGYLANLNVNILSLNLKEQTMAVPISVQLYSARNEMAEDVLGTLKKIASFGYAGVEPAGFYDLTPADFRKAVEDMGMKISSQHGPNVTAENFNEVVECSQTLGIDLVSHMGFGGGTTMDDLKAEADVINAMCDKLEAVGMSMFMHNHDAEFSTMFDGKRLFDVLFDMCPKLQTETDIYWVKVGQSDPVEVVKQYGSRMPLMHVKDGMVDPKFPMKPAGQGVIDIAGCLKAAEGGALRWAVVELDEAEGDMMDALKQSCEFLTGNGLALGTK
jgi:sugar phosphate isomerase/epimerase